MSKKIEGLAADTAEIAMMSNSEVPTIKFSEVCALIKYLDDTYDLIVDERQAEGFDAGVRIIKEWLLSGDAKITDDGDVFKALERQIPIETHKDPEVPSLDFCKCGMEVTNCKYCPNCGQALK